MKRTDRLTTLTVALIFIAMLSYIGLYAIRASANMTRTAYAVTSSIRTSAAATGITLRDEYLITCEMPFLQVTAADGKRIAKGQAVALSYGNESALERAERIRSLELELEYAEVLPNGTDGNDREIRNSVLALSTLVMRHELTGLDARARYLNALTLDSGAASREHRDIIAAELSDLRKERSYAAIPISAPEPGIFSALLDGYEHLSYSGQLSPTALRSLFDDNLPIPSNAIGKIVTSSTWYYAALMTESDTAMLRAFSDNSDTIPFRVRLEFAGNAPVIASLRSIGTPYDGECVVVFSCETALAETLMMRLAEAEVVFDELTGLRIPKQSIHSNPDGSVFVYVITGTQIEAKTVNIIHDDVDYYLVSRAVGSDSLREGNEIIVEGRDLYDGKIIR